MKPWGFWATVGLSFCVWSVFVAAQTIVFIVALAVYASQEQTMMLEDLTQNLATNGLILAIATITSAPLCIGLILLFIKVRQRGSITDYLQLRMPTQTPWKTVGIWCLITVGFIYIIEWLKALVRSPEASTFTLDIYKTAHFLPLLYIAIVIAAPVFEEIFFRGFVFQGILNSRLGAIGAVLFPSMVWAVVHSQYDPYDMGGIFLFGILLSVAQLMTKSLMVPIAMHSFNNLLALIMVAIDP